jgi:ribosomal-protein-alanine N-acetyltransferase
MGISTLPGVCRAVRRPGWLESFYMEGKIDPTVIIHGDSFDLRPWCVEDARWYVESRDDEVFRWTTERRDLTVAEAEDAIRLANKRLDALCLAIAGSPRGDLLGNIALELRVDDPTSAEIMYWLASEARGRGLATRAVVLLSAWAFGHLGLKRVLLKTRAGNLASQRVAGRAGFRRTDPLSTTAGAHPDNGKNIWFELLGP